MYTQMHATARNAATREWIPLRHITVRNVCTEIALKIRSEKYENAVIHRYGAYKRRQCHSSFSGLEYGAYYEMFVKQTSVNDWLTNLEQNKLSLFAPFLLRPSWR